jgi:PST family polysaccharide transporter
VAGQTVLQLGSIAALSRLLTPADFGIAAVGLSVVGVLQLLAQFGIAQSLVQRPRMSAQYLHAGVTLAMLLSLLLAAVMTALASAASGWLAVAELTVVLPWLALSLPIRALGYGAEAMLQRELRFRSLSTIEFLSFAVGYAVPALALAATGAGYMSLVAGHVGAALVRSILLLRAVPGTLGIVLHRRAYARTISYGRALATAQGAHALAVNLDNVVVARNLGTFALGTYSRAYQLLVMPATIVSNVMDRVLFPILSRIREQPKRLSHAVLRSVHLTALISLPLSALLYVTAPEIVAVLLGSQWAAVVSPFRVLSLVLVFRTTFQIGDAVARATGTLWASAARQAVYALAVLIGAWYGSRFGATGVATGVSAAIIVKYLLMAQLTLRTAGIGPRAFVHAHIGGAALGASALAVSLALAQLAHALDIPLLARLVLTFAVVPFAVAAVVLLAPAVILGPSFHTVSAAVSKRLPSATRFFQPGATR